VANSTFINCNLCENEKTLKLSRKVQFGLPWSAVMCKNCGLSYLNPQPTRDYLNSYYSSQYEKHYGNSTLGRARGYRIAAFLEQYGIPYSDVLEIGSGSGGNLQGIREKKPNVKLSVFEPGESSRRALARDNIAILGSFYDQENLSLKTQDLVLISHVLEHFLDPKQVLKKLWRECEDSCGLLIVVPSLKTSRDIAPPDKYWFRLVHTFYFSRENLEDLLLVSGWKPMHVEEKDGELWIFANKSGPMPATSIRPMFQENHAVFKEYKKHTSLLRYYCEGIELRLKRYLGRKKFTEELLG
jgi:SAM-dependent methyltransferase